MPPQKSGIWLLISIPIRLPLLPLPLPLSLLLLLLALLLPSSTALCIPNYSGCAVCQNSTHCSVCYDRTGLDSNGNCVSCVDIYCKTCDGSNPNICTDCQEYYVVAMGSCVKGENCTDPYCVHCPTNDFICLACQYHRPQLGLYDGNNTCTPCLVPFCTWCIHNASQCFACTRNYGLQSPTSCVSCSTSLPNCWNCDTNISYCQFCILSYGVNRTSPNGFCTPCQVSNCADCGRDHTVCIECIVGYGLTYTSCELCTNSPSFCANCNSRYLQECTSCPIQRYLFDSYCHCDVVNCHICNSSTNCVTCSEGYFRETNGTCSLCPDFCSLCDYSLNHSAPFCLQCDDALYQVRGNLPLCLDKCGDMFVINNQCDNEIGRILDGCTDDCKLQPNFQCIVNGSNITQICFYNGTIQLQLVSIQREQYQNFMKVKVKVQPPLYSFSLATNGDILQMFVIQNSGISIQNTKYTFIGDEFIIDFQCQFDVGFLNGETVTVDFMPMNSSIFQYFDGNNPTQVASFIINQNIYYYTELSFMTAKIVFAMSWVLVVIGILGCLAGVGLRKFGGLEAIFVLQIAFISFLTIQGPPYLPFTQNYSLLYSNGYNYPFSFSNSVQKLALSFYSQFNIYSSFLSNFNLSILAIFLAFLPVPVTWIRMRKYAKKHPEMELEEKLIFRFEQLNQYFEIAIQTFLYFCLFFLVYFTTCVCVFVQNGQFGDIGSWIGIGIVVVFYLGNFGKFVFDPYPYGYFRFSFDPKPLAMCYYYLYIIALISTPAIAIFLQNQSYLCLISVIPPLLLFLITAVYRPYKYPKQNLRSSVNLFTMCIVLAFNFYTKYIEQKTPYNPNDQSLWIFLLIIYCVLLPAVVVMGIVSQIYLFYYQKWILPFQEEFIQKQEKDLRQRKRRILKEFVGINDVNEKMRQVDNSTVFKQIIEPELTLFDGSKKYRNEMGQQENIEEVYSSHRPLKIQNLQQSQGQKYKQLKNMLKQIKTANPKKLVTNTYQSQAEPQPQPLAKQKQQESPVAQFKKSLKKQQQKSENKQLKIQKQLAQQILVDEHRYLEMRSAFDVVKKQMEKIQSPSASNCLKAFEEIQRKV